MLSIQTRGRPPLLIQPSDSRGGSTLGQRACLQGSLVALQIQKLAGKMQAFIWSSYFFRFRRMGKKGLGNQEAYEATPLRPLSRIFGLEPPLSQSLFYNKLR